MIINGFNEIVAATRTEALVVRMLQKYSRTDLREIARQWGIERGRNKTDTIKNISESEHFPRMFGMIV